MALSRRFRSFLWFSLAAFLMLNVVAAHHAYRFVTFSNAGDRTAPPERLDALGKAAVLLLGPRVPRPGRPPRPEDLPFARTRWASVITSDTAQISADYLPATGRKGSVFLFHGYAACGLDMAPEARRFRRLGYHVVLTDFRGSGGSEGRRTSFGLHEPLDVAAVLREAQKQNLPRPWIGLGMSMGAMSLVRAVAHQQAAFDGLILEGMPVSARVAVGRRFESMGLPARPLSDLLLAWSSLWTRGNLFEVQPARDLPNLGIPVLLTRGTMDPLCQEKDLRRMLDALGEYGLALQVPLAGHQPALRASGQAGTQTLSDWLAGFEP